MERHLAAILSANVVKYTAMMRRDEVGTLAALKAIRTDLVIPKTRQYQGRPLKLTGGGEIIEFPSIIDAVTCAVEIQVALNARNKEVAEDKQVQYRIGINIGDVIDDVDDTHGDGTVPSFLVENIAEPGGICLTSVAYSQVINQLGLDFKNLGRSEIKGFDESISIFSVVLDDKAHAMVTPVDKALAGARGVGDNTGIFKADRKGRRRAPLHWGLLAGGVVFAAYLGAGLVKYMNDGNRLTVANPFCPVVSVLAPAPNTVKIGAVLPTLESYGQRMRWGINRSLKDSRGNYPFAVSLNLQDSSDGLETVQAGLEHFDRTNILSIIGPMQSSHAYYAKKWANQANIPVISPLASASYLTKPGEFDYFFRTTMSDSAGADTLVEWIGKKGLQNSPYLIHEWALSTLYEDAPEIYGASQASAVKRYLGNVKTIRFTRGSENSILAATEQVENDGRAIMIFGYTSNVKIIIKALQDKGIMNDIFLMGAATKTLEEADILFPEKLHVVTPDVSEARALPDSAALRREFVDDNPDLEYDISAYYAYDSVSILLDAIVEARKDACANRIDGEMVAEALRNTPNKRRKALNSGFMADVQEVFFRYGGMKMIDGKFRHVGIEQ